MTVGEGRVMRYLKIVDECFGRLHVAGWSVGETCFQTIAGQVDGTNGENRLLARAPTQAAAWRLAVEPAAAAGMLDRGH